MKLMSFEYMTESGILIDTGDNCTIHDKPYYRRRKNDDEYTSHAFCLDCAAATLEARKRSEEERLSVNSTLVKTYSAFNSLSIIPKSLEDATIKNFEVKTTEEQYALAFAQRAIRHYGKGGVGNTILQGNAGVGKTHLALGIAKSLNETFKIYNEPKSVIFMPVARLIQKVQDSFNGQSRFTQEFATEMLTTCDYLVLDDFGKESSTGQQIKQVNEWTYRFLFNILDNRDKTIITTNFSRKELLAIYDEAFVDRLTKGLQRDPDRMFTFKYTESKR